MEKYCEFIKKWIEENRGIPTCDIDENANLFEKQYLDSLSVFGLIMDIEDDFGIKFTPEDLTSENAATVKGLASIAASK
jgi:acyl carrier protein